MAQPDAIDFAIDLIGPGQRDDHKAARAAPSPAPPTRGDRRCLARSLKRDYKRVYEDVEVLSGAGLIDRSPHGLRADYAEIHTQVAL